MQPANLGTTLTIAAIAIFGVYRRVRRNIGRQPLQPRRLWFRIVFFALICTAVGVAALNAPSAAAGRILPAMAAGALAGVLIALFALQHTEFEFTPQGNYYTPHLYIGLAVTALLVGRLLYRILQLYALQMPTITGAPPPPAFGSPLTLGILFVTAGYYICYNAGLLRRLRSARTPAV